MGSMMAHRNWDSMAAKCAASACNIAIMLNTLIEEGAQADEDHKITGKNAHTLCGSPKGDTDNVFVSYMGHDGEYSPHQFQKDKTDIDKLIHLSKKMPSKSCTPDWVVTYQGAPLLIGDGKSETDENAGLAKLALLSTRQLANRDEALVMQTTNTKMRIFRMEKRKKFIKADNEVDINETVLQASRWESEPYTLELLGGVLPTTGGIHDVNIPGVSNHE